MSLSIFWFRRDLRLEDNAGLYHALKSEKSVLPIFIFDKNILDNLERNDARVSFIYDTVTDLKKKINQKGSDLKIFYGKPIDIWSQIIKEFRPSKIYYNHDYEGYATRRDNEIQKLWQENNIDFASFKDHVIFEKNEVVKDDGAPYTVFTPYKRKWLAKLGDNISKSFYFQKYPSEKYLEKSLAQSDYETMISLESMGFIKSNIEIPSLFVKQAIITHYDKNRNFPAIQGTSRLGIHFRFGTISIREKAAKAAQLNDTYLSELIWRDFYSQILYHFPHVEHSSFRKEYDQIEWLNNLSDYEAWCQGMTGYPIVDAGMRELMHTGHMHNRVRMITASFLTKHLLIDWRWGEVWFAKHLLDFDLASNNGGWQWAAGCGTDAAPYFRIFNPEAQTKKFDPYYKYIKKWVPEFGTFKYPKPIVDHKLARDRCLITYKKGLSK
jgi:deoxyribodipyrimidine photo-lyase